MILKQHDRVGIVCCSNGLPSSDKSKLHALESALLNIGLKPVFSDCIYRKYSVFSGSGKERAAALMDFYMDKSVKAIFDISGGDIANELLPYLQYDIIAQSDKLFWGYSDLTVIINAIFARTGKTSVLYSIKNLIGDCRDSQEAYFANTVFSGGSKLLDFHYKFMQGTKMNGTVVGGNIRCFLKLAGTEFFPDTKDKILLLEALGGEAPQMTAYLNQLKQMGVFDRINGIILGTFIKMRENNCVPDIVSLVKSYTGRDIPIIKTDEIGHGADSKAVVIGKYYSFSEL